MATCNCTTQPGRACATSSAEIQIGTGISDGGGGGSDNGGTGGTLGSNNLCFDNTKYYTVQYFGSPDISVPYLGSNLNWYFGQLGFAQGSLELPPIVTEDCSNSTPNTPIQHYCQKSFVVLISDGLPNGDRELVSNLLKDYTGDCATKGLCDSTTNTKHLPGVSTKLKNTGTACNNTDRINGLNNMLCQNGTKAGRAYESSGSDYLDDVAQALYEMDLRPDLGASEKALTHAKNNLMTYTVGFADESLLDDITLKTSLLKDRGLLGCE
jgi:hypothetical protein